MHEPDADHLLAVYHQMILASVRHHRRDLTARQLAIFLTAYVRTGPQTVRGLASDLRLGKPAVTVALDLLEELGLIERLPDPADGRSILVGRTAAGDAYLREISALMVEAEQNVSRD